MLKKVNIKIDKNLKNNEKKIKYYRCIDELNRLVKKTTNPTLYDTLHKDIEDLKNNLDSPYGNITHTNVTLKKDIINIFNRNYDLDDEDYIILGRMNQQSKMIRRYIRTDNYSI